MTDSSHGPLLGVSPTVELAAAAPEAADALLIAAFRGDDGLEIPGSALLDADAVRATFDALSAVGATGKSGEVTRVPAPSAITEATGARSNVAAGLGESEDLTDETVRVAAGNAARALAGVGAVATTLGDFALGAAVEGIALGGYVHRGLRSSELEDSQRPATVVFVSSDEAAATDFERARLTAEATIFARNLVNTPSNLLYPESYANYLAETARSTEGPAGGVEVEVLDESALEEQGFGGILAVGRGSARPPRLVRLSYRPSGATRDVALVGKGITFDTGGISLKPGAGMWDMISDMGGSASMAAAVFAAAKLGLNVNVTATLPLAENMPGGNATRPGDVITHYGGITSEVLNTDAEGRLVLSDAIARASEDKPDYLIETATLTGAQIVALGERTAGVMGSEDFRDRVAEIGREVGEKAWAMPLLEEHEEAIKSPVADIRNIHTKREGGMEFAGTYLQRFVGEDIEWVHIDVAGPSWNGGSPYGYTTKRATGAPVRTVIAALAELADTK